MKPSDLRRIHVSRDDGGTWWWEMLPISPTGAAARYFRRRPGVVAGAADSPSSKSEAGGPLGADDPGSNAPADTRPPNSVGDSPIGGDTSSSPDSGVTAERGPSQPIGERICAELAARGWRQVDLARRVAELRGCSLPAAQTAISNATHGRTFSTWFPAALDAVLSSSDPRTVGAGPTESPPISEPSSTADELDPQAGTTAGGAPGGSSPEPGGGCPPPITGAGPAAEAGLAGDEIEAGAHDPGATEAPAPPLELTPERLAASAVQPPVGTGPEREAPRAVEGGSVGLGEEVDAEAERYGAWLDREPTTGAWRADDPRSPADGRGEGQAGGSIPPTPTVHAGPLWQRYPGLAHPQQDHQGDGPCQLCRPVERLAGSPGMDASTDAMEQAAGLLPPAEFPAEPVASLPGDAGDAQQPGEGPAAVGAAGHLGDTDPACAGVSLASPPPAQAGSSGPFESLGGVRWPPDLLREAERLGIRGGVARPPAGGRVDPGPLAAITARLDALAARVGEPDGVPLDLRLGELATRLEEWARAVDQRLDRLDTLTQPPLENPRTDVNVETAEILVARVAALERELVEVREELAGIQQERDDALHDADQAEAARSVLAGELVEVDRLLHKLCVEAHPNRLYRIGWCIGRRQL